MFGLNGLRVRALFPVINEQTKLNATDNVVVADFSRAAARRAAQSLAPHSASHNTPACRYYGTIMQDAV